MLYSDIARLALAAVCVAAAFALPPTRAARAADPADPLAINRGIIELETGGATDISLRMAEDIAGLIDDGTTRRVLPVLGKGALQTLTDLRFLRGIDLAIVPTDALDYAKEQRYLPGIESTLTYIAKLYNEELHLLARADIKNITDLANQTVNVGAQGGGTAVTATRLFDRLKIKVTTATDDQDVALQKLRRGEIAALVVVAAKPAPFFQGLKPGNGLHLLGIPLPQTVTAAYPPTQITAADYPDLVPADAPVDTIAVGNVLMAADLRLAPDRDRNLAKFVEALFGGFQTLLEPGHQAKWQEVNIAADLPGWTRYQPAAQWLQDHAQVAAAQNPDALKALFSQFIDERRQANGGIPMSATEKDALFQQFQAWQRGQAR